MSDCSVNGNERCAAAGEATSVAPEPSNKAKRTLRMPGAKIVSDVKLDVNVAAY